MCCTRTGLTHQHWTWCQPWAVTLHSKFSFMLCQWVFILQRHTEALDHAVGRQLWGKLIHREDLQHSKYKKQKLRMLWLFQMQAPLYGSILKDASQNPHADWVWSELLVLLVQWTEAALCHPSANAYPILPEVLGMRKLYEVFLFQRPKSSSCIVLLWLGLIYHVEKMTCWWGLCYLH